MRKLTITITGGRMLQVLATVRHSAVVVQDLYAQSDQASAAGPQGAATDERWTPWVGCWEPSTKICATASARPEADSGRLSNLLRNDSTPFGRRARGGPASPMGCASVSDRGNRPRPCVSPRWRVTIRCRKKRSCRMGPAWHSRAGVRRMASRRMVAERGTTVYEREARLSR